MSGIRIIGHRGAMGVEPENTLRSFRRAQRDGADEIELDIQLSADGHLVVMHDATVDRTTDGSGEVAALTLDQLRRLDAGLGERVPTFAEVLTTVELPIQTEVKARAAVEPLAALLRQGDMAGRITVSSHDATILAALTNALPTLERAFIAPHPPADLPARALAVGARWVAPGLAGLTAELMDHCLTGGLLVDAWPAPDPAALSRAIHLGAHAVTTDHPHTLRRWLDDRAPASAGSPPPS
jgi:glycerophosphoryl diester phosphodiesterase